MFHVNITNLGLFTSRKKTSANDIYFKKKLTLTNVKKKTPVNVFRALKKRQILQYLTRAPLGYSAERAPLGGGGQILPPA